MQELDFRHVHTVSLPVMDFDHGGLAKQSHHPAFVRQRLAPISHWPKDGGERRRMVLEGEGIDEWEKALKYQYSDFLFGVLYPWGFIWVYQGADILFTVSIPGTGLTLGNSGLEMSSMQSA